MKKRKYSESVISGNINSEADKLWNDALDAQEKTVELTDMRQIKKYYSLALNYAYKCYDQYLIEGSEKNAMSASNQLIGPFIKKIKELDQFILNENQQNYRIVNQKIRSLSNLSATPNNLSNYSHLPHINSISCEETANLFLPNKLFNQTSFFAIDSSDTDSLLNRGVCKVPHRAPETNSSSSCQNEFYVNMKFRKKITKDDDNYQENQQLQP